MRRGPETRSGHAPLALGREHGELPFDSHRTPREVELDLKVLRAVGHHSGIGPRDLARHLGIGIGTIDRCLRCLASRGLMRVSVPASPQECLYGACRLTHEGRAAKTALTRDVLQLKLAMCEALAIEIEHLQQELDKAMA